MHASIRDVAPQAGDSVGTVSNVLDRSAGVGAATGERVPRGIEAFGSVRDRSARRLPAGVSRRIGLVVLGSSKPLSTDVARGVDEVADAQRLSVVLGTCDSRVRRGTAS